MNDLSKLNGPSLKFDWWIIFFITKEELWTSFLRQILKNIRCSKRKMEVMLVVACLNISAEQILLLALLLIFCITDNFFRKIRVLVYLMFIFENLFCKIILNCFEIFFFLSCYFLYHFFLFLWKRAYLLAVIVRNFFMVHKCILLCFWLQFNQNIYIKIMWRTAIT